MSRKTIVTTLIMLAAILSMGIFSNLQKRNQIA